MLFLQWRVPSAIWHELLWLLGLIAHRLCVHILLVQSKCIKPYAEVQRSCCCFAGLQLQYSTHHQRDRQDLSVTNLLTFPTFGVMLRLWTVWQQFAVVVCNSFFHCELICAERRENKMHTEWGTVDLVSGGTIMQPCCVHCLLWAYINYIASCVANSPDGPIYLGKVLPQHELMMCIHGRKDRSFDPQP